MRAPSTKQWLRPTSALLAGLAAAFCLCVLFPSAAEAGELRPYQRLIERVAERHRLCPKLFAALVDEESARNSQAVSHKGAIGLAQLMPATARRFGVKDPRQPEDNLEGAARYLRFLLARYDFNERLAIAAYNAGEGAVDRYGGVPNYPETRRFVRRVLARAGRDPKPSSVSFEPEQPQVRLEKEPDGSIVITNLPEGFSWSAARSE